MTVLLHRATGAVDGEGESSSEASVSSSSTWLGWLTLGLRKTLGSSGNSEDEALPAPEVTASAAAIRSGKESPPSAAAMNHKEPRGKHDNALIAATTCPLDAKDHAKPSPFAEPATVSGGAAKDIESRDSGKTGAKSNETTDPVAAKDEPPCGPRRMPTYRRQPTGDEDDFADVLSASGGSDDTSEDGSSMKQRHGLKSAVGGSTEADEEDQTNQEDHTNQEDQANNQEESASNDGGTSRSDDRSEDSKQSRCKPLLQRKPTGDEDDWKKVVPPSTRRGRRCKGPSQDNDANVDQEDGARESTTDQTAAPPAAARRSRPVVARQQTGDASTFPTRAPRRGGRKSAPSTDDVVDKADDGDNKQEGLPPPVTRARKLINRTPTGDFSEGDPISSQGSSGDDQPKRASRPTVRRQATGDGTDFAAAVAPPSPRRGRRNNTTTVEASEHSQSQSVEDSTNESEHRPLRRSRPKVRRQPTGDLCDFNALQQDVASRAPRQQQRRPRGVDNDQSASWDPSGGESDDPNEETCGESNRVEESEVVEVQRRSRPTVRRQATGDMTHFALGASSSSSAPSSPRKGRRRNRDDASESQSSTTTSSPAVRITRVGLVRKVTDDGSSSSRTPPNPNMPPSPMPGPDSSLLAAWVVGGSSSAVLDSTADTVAAADSERGPVAPAGLEETPVVAKSGQEVLENTEPEAKEEARGLFLNPDAPSKNGPKNSPKRGVRRNPTGDLDAFFLQESPLKSGLPKAPQRSTSNSQESQPVPPSGLRTTPLGDEGNFAMLLDDESDDESGGSLVDARMKTPSNATTATEGCGTVKVTRGVRRAPTGDEADFAMLLDGELDGDESSGSTAPSTVTKKGPVAVEKRRGVKRMPTGDEADFAMLLGSESDGDGTSGGTTADDSTPSPEGPATEKTKSRGVQRTPTGDEVDFAMLLGMEDGESSCSTSAAAAAAGEAAAKAPRRRVSEQPASTKKGGESVEKTRGVHRTPTGDEADFAMLLGVELDGDESSGNFAAGIEATKREAITKSPPAPKSRGVKRTPTGDGLDFAMYIDDEENSDGENDKNEDYFTKDLEDAKRAVSIAAVAGGSHDEKSSAVDTDRSLM